MNHFVIPGLAAILAVSFSLFAPVAEAKTKKSVKLTFEVEDGKLELKRGRFSTTPSNCARKDHPGCYEFNPNDFGDFELVLKGGDNDCSDADDWKFHSVVLGGESEITNPADKPGPDDWGGISAEAAQDFSADQASGEINFNVTHKRKVTFRDENDYPLSIWYKVSVQRCGDETEILSYDPRVDNRGLPGN